MPILFALFAACTRAPFQEGVASWYGPGLEGNLTASGVMFDPDQLTAAHLSLPFGTEVEVVRVDTGAAVTVTVNDRGPFVAERIVDLSPAAAQELDLLDVGTTLVELHPNL